jgi:hypothetical protein
MDIKKIFDLFIPEEVKEQNDSGVYLDLSNHPVIFMGMFKKLISNYEIFSAQLVKFLESSDDKLDTDDIKRAGAIMVYDRAYTHLEKLDLNNSTHTECLGIWADEVFIDALDASILHYENLEEYEKCVFLSKIKNISQK